MFAYEAWTYHTCFYSAEIVLTGSPALDVNVVNVVAKVCDTVSVSIGTPPVNVGITGMVELA